MTHTAKLLPCSFSATNWFSIWDNRIAFTLLIFVTTIRAFGRSPEFNQAVLKQRRIVPDVIPTAPGERLEVSWAHANLKSGDEKLKANDVVEAPHNVTHPYINDSYYVVIMSGNTNLSWELAIINFGMNLDPNDVTDPPFFSFWPRDKDAYYVLIFSDPDVPSRENPTKREYLHWLVGNIYEDKWHTGEEIAAYIGAIPEHMNGIHRMVFVVYKQPGPDFITFTEKRLRPVPSDKDRAGFSTRKFAKKYNLTGPIAANFFMAHWTQDMVATLKTQTTTPTEDPLGNHTDSDEKIGI